ncbi:MAG: VanZ family protein [Chitinophagaceae bacterium]
MRKNKLPLLPAIAWLIISTVLLTLPGSAFPKEDWLSKIWFDKWVHIGLFTIMVFLCCWAITKLKKNNLKKLFLITALISLIYGIGMEFVQKYFITNRSFDIGDIIADAIGCVTGFFYSWGRYIKNRPL